MFEQFPQTILYHVSYFFGIPFHCNLFCFGNCWSTTLLVFWQLHQKCCISPGLTISPPVSEGFSPLFFFFLLGNGRCRVFILLLGAVPRKLNGLKLGNPLCLVIIHLSVYLNAAIKMLLMYRNSSNKSQDMKEMKVPVKVRNFLWRGDLF